MPALIEINSLETEIPTRGRVVRPARGIDLVLNEGECLGIAGESGCGKTMLLLSIMRLLPPGARIAGGSIMFEGRDLTKSTQAEMLLIRGKRIAMVFQEPMTALNPVFTIGSQLTECIRQHSDKQSRAEARERAEELLHDMRIPSPAQRLGQYPHELSGGMRQRVMLAMALASNPALVLADEPTSSLDVTVQAQIISLLSTLRSQYKLSLVFVSHDLALLSQLCDRIAIMYLGRVVEVGRGQDVIAEARHPYTSALLACLPPEPDDGPRPSRESGSFQEIPGNLSDPSAIIPGCQFHPRCPKAIPRCRSDSPALSSVTDTHQVACFVGSGGEMSRR